MPLTDTLKEGSEMKKSVMTVVAVTMLVAIAGLSGCALTKTANLKPEPDDVSYRGFGISLIDEPPGPVEMAQSVAIVEDAKGKRAVMEGQKALLEASADAIRKNTAGASSMTKPTRIAGVIINDNLKKTLHFDNPQMSLSHGVPVGRFEYLYLDKLPDKITYWWEGHQSKRTARVKVKKGGEPDTYNGVPVDFIVRIR